jgi:hypothetical protein
MRAMQRYLMFMIMALTFVACRANDATPTRPRTSSSSSVSSTSPGQTDSLFDALIAPFVAEANKRRADAAKNDPEYAKRIDKDLNLGRINFLLYGYGETHEPPTTEKALIGSHTIISYDTRTRTANLVSLTHDIRAPEIERELVKKGNTKSGAVRIDQAYNVGGFKLMRQTLENATGLSIDFQMTFRDSVMQGVIDNVFQGVEVTVPRAFEVNAFYLDGIKYDAGKFSAGKQKLNGRQVIQFIKTVPVSDGYYGKDLEHNARKHLVFQGLLNAIETNYADKWFWARASAFVASQLATGNIVYDFDPVALMVNNIDNVSPLLTKLTSQENAPNTMPKIKKSVYIVDPAHGDGGVQWITANAATNPITQKDIDAGVYRTIDLEVPLNANPYGDLVTEYWASVRAVVKQIQ